MSATAAIAAVFGLLKTAPNLGPNIYSQMRFAKDDAAFKSIFVDSTTNPADPIVHAWMVTREATPAKDEAMQAMSRTHAVVMIGYRGFQDNVTEPIWQAEIEAITGLFAPYASRRFNNTFDFSGPPMVEGVKLVWLGSYLCHTARIVHTVREFPIP